MDEHVSIPEFARRSGFSHSTIRRRLRDGSLPRFQPGGPGTRIVIPLSALHSNAPAPEAAESGSVAVPTAERGGRRPQWMSSSGRAAQVRAGGG
jgi:hypothetical protein